MTGPLALLVAIGFVSAPARAATIWESLPFAALMRPDLEKLTEAALRIRAEALRQRLFIDEQTILLERGEDLELVIGYAASIALIAERGGDDPGLAGAERSAAYLLFETGVQCETRTDLRYAVSALGDREEAPAQALAKSVKALRAYGRSAFAAALGTEVAGLGVAAHAQAGRVALDDGDAMTAADHFMQAAASDPLPRFAVASCEALLMLSKPEATALCERLEQRFTAKFPASAGRFAEVRRHVADRLSSNQFGRDEATATLPAIADEAWRRVRLGLIAERLTKTAVERFPTEPAAWHLAAEIALAERRLDDLRTILAAAPEVDARLNEARLAASVAVAIDRLLGKKIAKRDAPWLDGLDAEIAAFTGAPETARQLRVIAALARDEAPAPTLAKEAPAAPLAQDASPEAVALALFVPLVGGTWERDARKLATTDFGKSLYARVEIGLGLANRDGPRIEKALAALHGDDPTTVLTRIVAARGLQALHGGALATAGLGDDRAALGRLAFAFDEATPMGRVLAQARASTLATLELRDQATDRAVELMREARRFGGELAPLAAGTAQLLIGDAPGAAELCERGAAKDAAVKQSLLACRALGAAQPQALWSEVEGLWDEAAIPPILQPGTARPLFIPAFELGVTLLPGEPLRLTVRFEPVALLAPEIVPSRAEVRTRD